MTIETVVYEAVDAAMPADRFMAFIMHEENGRKRRSTVYFRADTAQGARDVAIAFWNDANAKKVAMAERGRKLGMARRKRS